MHNDSLGRSLWYAELVIEMNPITKQHECHRLMIICLTDSSFMVGRNNFLVIGSQCD